VCHVGVEQHVAQSTKACSFLGKALSISILFFWLKILLSLVLFYFVFMRGDRYRYLMRSDIA